MERKAYELPKLPYGYGDLKPHMSEEQLRLHHDKHHAAYVKGANDLLEKMDTARKDDAEPDMKSTLKALSFNMGGHILHSLFWANMAPEGRGGGEPGGRAADAISSEFGSIERFRKEFALAANSAEGSGWAALAYHQQSGRLMVMQIEKHNVNVIPSYKLILVLDVWEHAYYLDYKNERAKFVDAFWHVVNWGEVDERLRAADNVGDECIG
jgi:superoxide dismutase, Fe-Mn family